MAQDVDRALENLKQIKQGNDPRANDDTDDRPDEWPPNEFHNKKVRTKQNVYDLFVECVNLCEPHHDFIDNPYPITERQVEHTWCTSSGSYRAKCGPKLGPAVVHFSIDDSTVCKLSEAACLRMIVHELTHITEHSDTPGSAHNPRFWKTMMRNARTIMDNLDSIESLQSTVREQDFAYFCVHNPNRSMVDGRMRTVKEQKLENRRRLDADYVPIDS